MACQCKAQGKSHTFSLMTWVGVEGKAPSGPMEGRTLVSWRRLAKQALFKNFYYLFLLLIVLYMSPISSFFPPKACCFLELLSSSESIFIVRGDCLTHGVQGRPSLNHLSGSP